MNDQEKIRDIGSSMLAEAAKTAEQEFGSFYLSRFLGFKKNLMKKKSSSRLPRRREENRPPPLKSVYEIISVESQRDAFRYGEMSYRTTVKLKGGRYQTWRTSDLQELNHFISEFNQEQNPHRRWVRSKSALPRRRRKKKSLSQSLPVRETLQKKRVPARVSSPDKSWMKTQTLPLNDSIMKKAKEAASIHVPTLLKSEIASKIATLIVNTSPPPLKETIQNPDINEKESFKQATTLEALKLQLTKALKRIDFLENEVKELKSTVANMKN